MGLVICNIFMKGRYNFKKYIVFELKLYSSNSLRLKCGSVEVHFKTTLTAFIMAIQFR